MYLNLPRIHWFRILSIGILMNISTAHAKQLSVDESIRYLYESNKVLSLYITDLEGAKTKEDIVEALKLYRANLNHFVEINDQIQLAGDYYIYRATAYSDLRLESYELSNRYLSVHQKVVQHAGSADIDTISQEINELNSKLTTLVIK